MPLVRPVEWLLPCHTGRGWIVLDLRVRSIQLGREAGADHRLQHPGNPCLGHPIMSAARSFLAAAAFLAVAAVPASAQNFTYYNICGVSDGTSLRICASADLTLSGSTLTMRVWNMEVDGASGVGSYASEFGGWHTITSVGLQYVGSGVAASGDFTNARYVFGTGTTDYRNLTYWRGSEDGGRNPLQVDLGSVTQGHKDGIVGCVDPGPTSAGHVMTCDSYGFMPYVEFTFTDVDPNLDFAQYYFEFHGQQMVNGRSAKGSGPGTPTEVVPEPITMVLLASGLAGVGGVGVRRRRREDQDQDDASS